MRQAALVDLRSISGHARVIAVTMALAMTSLLCVTAPASAETPTAYMQRVADELVAAQKMGSTSAFANTLRKHMDVPAVANTALGPYSPALPRSERPAYYTGMVNFISRYAAKEGPKYPVSRAVVVGRGEDTAGGTMVDMRLQLRSGESYDVRWKVVRSGGGYKVRDAQVIGFWMTSFLDTLFQNFITENGNNPRALVMALNR